MVKSFITYIKRKKKHLSQETYFKHIKDSTQKGKEPLLNTSDELQKQFAAVAHH